MPDKKDDGKKFQPAVQMGERGGKVGGPARAKALKPARRTEIAKRAANVRWGNEKPSPKKGK